MLPSKFNTMTSTPIKQRIILTGATGYVGGRLAPRLLEAGHDVRCLARSPKKLRARPWSDHQNLSIAQTDLHDVESLSELLEGYDVAYYLIHSMQSSKDYSNVDNDLAANFSEAARRADIKRIIYLGGLGETGDQLSDHLQSRCDVGEILGLKGVSVTTLRAAMIIGSGSASFEILRYLVERLPLMITPKWVTTESQPISIIDVLHYLETCIVTPETEGKIIDIGGSEVLTYHALMDIMANELGLRKRRVIPVPVLTPRLSSYWIHVVTPVSAQIARPLAEGLTNRVVCRNNDVQAMMPHETMGPQQAIHSALAHETVNEVATSWLDAGPVPGDPDWSGGKVYIDKRCTRVKAGSAALYEAITVIGGGHGYYASDWLWKARGILDKFLGGPGLRRGRRDQRNIVYGDALDFWRVLHADPGKRLTLFAEMKLPGVATLEFDIEVDPEHPEYSTLDQVAHFRPRGLLGILYWLAVKPLHGIVFNGMLHGIEREAERIQQNESSALQEVNHA
jgi:uncharacterized protein YbjT (DUF2867 family)